jgi:hypothetical protein
MLAINEVQENNTRSDGNSTEISITPKVETLKVTTDKLVHKIKQTTRRKKEEDPVKKKRN